MKSIKDLLAEIYNCGTCRFSYYNQEDRGEGEKCSIVGRFGEFSVNEAVYGIIENYNLKDVCEYWRKREKNTKAKEIKT